MSVRGGLGGRELGDLEELLLVGCEIIVCLGGAPIVSDSRRELVAEDVVDVVPFGGGGVGVRGEVHEQHPFHVEFFNRGHVAADLGEEDGCCLVVAIRDRGNAAI